MRNTKAIPFNIPYSASKCAEYVNDVMNSKKLGGNGKYTQLCHDYFENKFGFKKVLLTSSCTDALEMCALLVDVKNGDEVIVPSYSFPSSVNPFLMRGAKIVFADSLPNHPNIDVDKVERLITPNTKAIVTVHYGGISANTIKLRHICDENDIILIEDAAHAIDAKHEEKYLGSIGHLAAFSFHESKNIQCGEGGLLIINDEKFINRAEVIWEKGTNRVQFKKGLIPYYNWIDIGSSFMPSELVAAYLLAQLEELEYIQKKRIAHWNLYYKLLHRLEAIDKIRFPEIPEYARGNAHLFYIFCKSKEQRSNLEKYLNSMHIKAFPHYTPLHKNPYFVDLYDREELPNSITTSNCLLRLPLYVELTNSDILNISNLISSYLIK